MFEVCLEVFLCTMQEPLRLHVSCTEGQEIDGSKASLLARWYKDNDWHLGRVLAYRLIDWLHHGNEPGWGVGDVKTLRQEKMDPSQDSRICITRSCSVNKECTCTFDLDTNTHFISYYTCTLWFIQIHIKYYLYVQLQRDRPDVGVEVEQSMSGGTQPLAEVLGIGHGGTEGHDPHLTLYLRGHVAHARTHHLQYRL